MCLSKLCNNLDGDDDAAARKPSRSTLGRIVARVVAEARRDGRLVCGLVPAIACLDKAADDAVVCLLAESRPGDSSAHMHTVLLQAFCYEHRIPVVKVDSGERLAALCAEDARVACKCAIVTADANVAWNADDDYGPPMTDAERALADFYEATLDEYPPPVVQLLPR